MAEVAAPITPVVAPPVATEAPKAEAKPVAEDFLEYTVDGKTEKVTRAEALKRLSKAGYADSAIKQAKDALKATQAEKAKWAAEQKQLEEDEEAYLRAKGRDPEAMAQRILERKLKEQGLTPEQRQAEQLQAENAKLKKDKEEWEAKTKAEQVEQHATKMLELMESELRTKAEAAGIKAGAKSFNVIYELVKETFELGLPWDADRIIEVAKETLDGATSELRKTALASLEGQALEDAVGSDITDRLIAHRIAVRQGKKTFGVKPAVVPPVEAKPTNPYITVAEASAMLRGMRNK